MSKRSEPWILGPSRIAINPDGPKRSTAIEESVQTVLARLEKYTLSPNFHPYVRLAHRGIQLGPGRHLDLGPLFADAPHALSFFAGFLEFWSPFRIVTDDAELIEVLWDAISANESKPAHVKAYQEMRARRMRPVVLVYKEPPPTSGQ
jgi:hypothetical protein